MSEEIRTIRFADSIKDTEFMERLADKKNAMLFWNADRISYEKRFLPVRERIRVSAVLEGLIPLLNENAPEPEIGWINAAFAFLQDLNFGRGFISLSDTQKDLLLCALRMAQHLLDIERKTLPAEQLWDFAFCTKEEIALYDRNGEYARFLAVWRRDFVYEMMRLAQEITPYHTLEHIAGVHAVATTITRELVKAGAPVNPAILSAAAATHDIGKYGCKAGERVPYLHYYYTDKWCASRDLLGIGRIAANHSSWDLEAENLSAESLALIYSDFRVKQSYDEEGEHTTIFSLEDSYEVILDKLDNVDAAKKQRYGLVYAKLFDFEKYMKRLGVDVSLNGRMKEPLVEKNSVFLTPEEVAEAFRMMAVRDNLYLTHQFGQERLFSDMLEAVRSEKNWIRVRAYLSIFEEYYNYLNTSQKVQALDFLYDLLVSPERDISRQAATLMGLIVAHFNLGYRKTMPEGTVSLPDDDLQLAQWERCLSMLIRPDRRFTGRQVSYLHYMLGVFVQHTFEFCLDRDQTRFRAVLLQHYQDPVREDAEEALALMDVAQYIPVRECTMSDLDVLFRFAAEQLKSDDVRLRVAALQYFRKVAEELPRDFVISGRITSIVGSAETTDSIAASYLKNKILRLNGLAEEDPHTADPETIRQVFLENFKTAVPWMVKKANVSFLADQEIADGDYLHIATHLANLIEVGEVAAVRYTAGEALLRVGPKLTSDQKNEVAVELTRGLEVGQFVYSKYIPMSLGRFCLLLRAPELDELITSMETMMTSANDSSVSGAISTIGYMLEYYDTYVADEDESESARTARRDRLLGIVLKQLSSHREIVRQEAMWVLGRSIFGSDTIPEKEKASIFLRTARKLLFIIREYNEDYQAQFYLSAMLSHLYRFLVRWEEIEEPLRIRMYERVAFFPGTFDPFSLSHKEIVRQIRDLGFEVYLAIDEFSWRKKTEPGLIRRRIAAMSVADEFHVTLFPHEIPINIANTDDLEVLKSLFPDQAVYLVVGSDVITGASAYRALPSGESVHAMNHIVIRRDLANQEEENDKLAQITGDVVLMTLPEQFSDISSTLIRENIDRNQDISGMMDSLAMEYIAENGLYRREPLYKPVIRPDVWRVGLADTAAEETFSGHTSEQDSAALSKDVSRRMVLARVPDTGGETASAGISVIRSSDLFHILGSVRQAEAVRKKASGRLLLIEDLRVSSQDDFDQAAQLVLTEALAYGVEEDCDYALFRPKDGIWEERVRSLLLRQGFVSLTGENSGIPVMLVNLRAPVVLFLDIGSVLKDPFAENPRILAALSKAHKRLQEALTRAYPGELILSLNAGILYDRLLTKITALNEVPKEPVTPRVLGKYMCVPFGKMLRGIAVPNTVTKTIYTETVYESDLSKSEISSFPDYAPLMSQVRMIRSFGRPIILVDDLMHNATEIQAIDNFVREEQLEIRQVLVGVLSGHGRDILERKGRDVDCVYFIPNLRAWFSDTLLYPFIGGDTVRRQNAPLPGFRSSVNLVMPYTYPGFYHESPPRNSYLFSRTCLENARDILLVLEAEYREKYGRSLTLSRLSEVIDLPLCPDKGGAMRYDPNRVASVYVENDLEQLDRMEGMFRE